MIFLFKAIAGLLLFQTIVAYDGDDLQAEPSQDSFSSSVNSIVLQQGQPFTLATGSFSSNVNGQRSGGTFVSSNNDGQVAFTPGRQMSQYAGNGFGNSDDVVVGGEDYQIYNTGNIRSDLPGNTPYWWVANNSPFTAAKAVDGGVAAVNCVSANECYDNQGRLVAMVYESTNLNSNSYKNGDNNGVVGKRDYSQNPFLNGDYAAATGNNVVRRQSSVGQSYGGSNTNNQYPSDSSAFASNQFLSVGSGQQPQAYYTEVAATGQRNDAFAPNGNTQQQFSSQSAYAGLGSGFVKASSFVDEPKQYLPPVPTPQPCNGRGQACVPSQQCQNGFIGQAQYAALGLASNNQNCNPNFEVCCTIEAPQTPRPVAPSTYRPTQPPQTYRPTAPPQTQRPYYDTTQTQYIPPATNRPTPATQRPTQPRPTQPRPTQPRPTQPRPTAPPARPCAVNGNACVSPQLCRSGSISSSAVPRGSSSTGVCNAPNVCCRIQAENNNQYLPPIDGDASNTNNNYLATSPRPTTEKPERDYEFNPSDDNKVVLRPTPPPRPVPQRPTSPPRDFDNDASSNVNLFIPVGCPAAMNCTQIEFCTAQAVISKTQVVLTPQQQEFRVPMTDCRDLEKGFIGKCCRDPDYTDPWPVGQLGQYNEEAFGFKPDRSQSNPGRPRLGESELSRPRPSGEPTLTATTNQFISRVPSPQQPSASSTSTQFRTPQPQQNSIPNTQTKTSPFQPARPTANIVTSTSGGFDQVPGSSGICGVRNYDNAPRGSGPFDTAFGEFPWQAMILLESNKSLLCGGAITDKNMVVTAAHCVQGLRPYDVLVKAGEWRLGSDEEPKPFQLIRVKKVMLHPAYQPTNLNYDVALLELENSLNYDNHIAPICIDDAELDTSATSNCVTTGWGKNVLKVHISNALMHQSPCTILPQDECESALSGYGFNPDSSYCGRTQDDACDLDAGSALACDDGTGKYYLKGVYSTESECASPSQLVTFSKTDFSWVKTASNPTGYTSQPSRLYQTAASSITTKGQNQYLPPV